MKTEINAFKKIRETTFYKYVALLLTLAFLNLVFNSCNKDNDPENIPMINYENNAVMIGTNEDGEAIVNADIFSNGENFKLTFKFLIQDQQGKALKNIKILYGQVLEKVIIYIYDENNHFHSTYFIGTPRELEQYFGNLVKTSSTDIESVETNEAGHSNDVPVLKESEAIITLTIIALITLASITVAQIGIILNAYKIQEFYLTDYVQEADDYILYCKTFTEIAELIRARTMIVLKTSSVFISFLTLGVGGAPSHAIEIVKEGAMWGVQELRDELVSQAIDAWGVSMNELANKKVAVKVYPYEESGLFSSARNLFAVYTIEMDNPICQESGSISGTITDAESGSPIEGVMVKLTGPVNRTDVTDQNGKYSFSNLSSGNFTLTASKNNFITEIKDIVFDGNAVVVNFVMTKNLSGNQYRIVLTWGLTPEDMDLHLYTLNGDHIYYNNQGSLNSYPFIYLDTDDMHSYGPETITINSLQSSKIYVHNYSGETDIKNSNSDIKVYKGNQKIMEYSVPQSGSGRWWYVFDISSNGTITDKNYLLNRSIPETSIEQKSH